MTSEAPSWRARPRPGDPRGAVMVAVFAVGWVLSVLLLHLLLAVTVTVAANLLFGADEAQGTLALLSSPEQPAWWMALLVSVQFPTLMAVTVATPAVTARLLGSDPIEVRYPLHLPGAAVLLAVTAAGLTTGWLPGWVAGQLAEQFPIEGSSSIELIARALGEGWWGWRLWMILWVVVGAPIVEEWVFRGLLWDAFSRVVSPVAVWGATSLFFAAYHMDPYQSPALLFTAGVAGWVRWHTGSLAPCILLHVINNALGVAVLLGWGADAVVPDSVVLGGTLVSLSACGVVWWFRPRDAAMKGSA